MLQLLAQEADSVPVSQEQMVAVLDRVLEGSMIPGEFVWDESLSGGFLSVEYPYLYYRLK